MKFFLYIEFFINDVPKYASEDQIYSIDRSKSLLTSGKQGMVFPIPKLKEYYDHVNKELTERLNIKFSLKITNPKLDAVAKAKDENVESGVEDSDHEN